MVGNAPKAKRLRIEYSVEYLAGFICIPRHVKPSCQIVHKRSIQRCIKGLRFGILTGPFDGGFDQPKAFVAQAQAQECQVTLLVEVKRLVKMNEGRIELASFPVKTSQPCMPVRSLLQTRPFGDECDLPRQSYPFHC